MTRLEIQTVIENRLGQRTGLAQRIQGELRNAQRHFEHKAQLPWFLRKTAVFLSQAQYMNMPVDFLRETDDEYLLAILDGDFQTGLKKRDYQYIVSFKELVGPGKPQFYTMESDQNQGGAIVNLFPQPDGFYQYRMVYYGATPELLGDGSENAWTTFAPDILVNQAGLEIAKALRSPEAVQLFASGLVEATKDLWFSHVAQSMAGLTDLTMGG